MQSIEKHNKMLAGVWESVNERIIIEEMAGCVARFFLLGLHRKSLFGTDFLSESVVPFSVLNHKFLFEF